eukprot:7958112-Pyramimonas_sp.AAC.2
MVDSMWDSGKQVRQLAPPAAIWQRPFTSEHFAEHFALRHCLHHCQPLCRGASSAESLPVGLLAYYASSEEPGPIPAGCCSGDSDRGG